jgi:hypothetical protein
LCTGFFFVVADGLWENITYHTNRNSHGNIYSLCVSGLGDASKYSHPNKHANRRIRYR